MKAILYSAPREYSLTEVEKPVCGENQVLIRVKACGICKTDLHIHEGSFISEFPLINGHEFAGEIVEVGSGVTEWKIGDRVTADNTELCGYCDQCRANRPLYCENFDSHGCNLPGGFAEYIVINKEKVFAISDKISYEEATFVEPTACAVHGVDRIKPNFGDSAVMFGAGPTGIILAQLLRWSGVNKFVIADPNQKKLDILKKLGFTDLVLVDRDNPTKHYEQVKAISPKGYDIVIDATGVASVVEACFNFAKKGSKIVVYGVCDEDALISISPYKIFSEEYQIIGSFAQTHCFDRAISYIESGKVVVKDLISHVLPIEKYSEAIDLINNKEAIKVIIQP